MRYRAFSMEKTSDLQDQINAFAKNGWILVGPVQCAVVPANKHQTPPQIVYVATMQKMHAGRAG